MVGVLPALLLHSRIGGKCFLDLLSITVLVTGYPRAWLGWCHWHWWFSYKGITVHRKLLEMAYGHVMIRLPCFAGHCPSPPWMHRGIGRLASPPTQLRCRNLSHTDSSLRAPFSSLTFQGLLLASTASILLHLSAPLSSSAAVDSFQAVGKCSGSAIACVDPFKEPSPPDLASALDPEHVILDELMRCCSCPLLLYLCKELSNKETMLCTACSHSSLSVVCVQ